MSHPVYGKDGLRLDPIHTRDALHRNRSNPNLWWYEDRDGIWIGNGTDCGVIPIRQLRAFLARHKEPR